MSNIPTVLPKPPILLPTNPKRWPQLNDWTTRLIQALSKNFGIVGADFDAINRTLVNANPVGGFPIVVDGTSTPLCSAIATLNNITQLVMVVANISLTTDGGDDPVIFTLSRGVTQIASDYLPSVGAGQSVGKTLVGIDSALTVGQYVYECAAQTAGGGGNTNVTAAKIAVLVI